MAVYDKYYKPAAKVIVTTLRIAAFFDRSIVFVVWRPHVLLYSMRGPLGQRKFVRQTAFRSFERKDYSPPALFLCIVICYIIWCKQ